MSFSDDFLAQQRILVITPHADDETYGCAGTIARTKALGGQVYVMLVSVADFAHYGNGLVTGDTRVSEFSAVMRYLKVDDWDVLFTDADKYLALDTIPRKELVDWLESRSRLAIDKVNPTMVMIPARSYNQDHEALFLAGVTATRPGCPGTTKHTVPFVLAYDNTSLFWSGDSPRFNPNVYIDISEYLEVKIEALRMHTSQLRGPLYHGSPDNLELATRLRGREVSVEAAEGFMLLRGVF
jgi:LmbE family N-acetylglucosaminyl deacetylase